MKIITLLFLTFFLGRNCETRTNQEIELAIIEYHTSTRGFDETINLQKKQILVTTNKRGVESIKKSTINNSDWEELIAILKKIKVNEISKLKDPTQKRFYDGAAIANLKITFKEKTYESCNFDHGNPPQELKELVEKIIIFSDKHNDN